MILLEIQNSGKALFETFINNIYFNIRCPMNIRIKTCEFTKQLSQFRFFKDGDEEGQCRRSVVLVEADEKSVVKCIVISPKGKQKSLISVQHPCSIVNNRFFIPERPKKNNARVRSKLYIQKGLTHFSLPSNVNNSYTSLFNIRCSK